MARRDSLEMIARGVAFALATELFQRRKEIAQRLAPETAGEGKLRNGKCGLVQFVSTSTTVGKASIPKTDKSL